MTRGGRGEEEGRQCQRALKERVSCLLWDVSRKSTQGALNPLQDPPLQDPLLGLGHPP